MRIEPPLEKMAQENPLPAFIILLLGLAVGVILYAFFSRSSSPISDFTVLESQNTKVYSPEKNLWISLKSGDSVRAGSMIQSWPDGSTRLRCEQSLFSLKENTALKIQKRAFFGKNHPVAVILERGTLLVSAENQNSKITIPSQSTFFSKRNFFGNIFPVLRAEFKNADVMFSALPEYSRYRVSVSEGSVKITGRLPWKPLEISKGRTIEWPVKDSEEINQTPESQTAASRDQQSAPDPESERLIYDLSKGILFSTKSGKSAQILGLEPATGDAFSEFTYDVLQPSSLAGINFPAEEIEISKFSSLKIQFQKVQGRGFPESFRIEFKSGDQVIRVFTGNLKPEEAWQIFSFPLRFAATAKISEISLLFSNGKVGASKEGSLRVKNISLG